MLEFGAQSTGKPNEPLPVHCHAAAHVQGVQFPVAIPQVMRAERTFWEKATAIHVFCAQGAFRGGDAYHFARHWHDMTRLGAAGFADAAIGNKALENAVADHKSVFFVERTLHEEWIDYHATVSGRLRLVLHDHASAKLAADYQRMIDDALFLDNVEPFEALLERCRQFNRR